MPKMPEMPNGKWVTSNSDIPAISSAIRAPGSVALDLETYGPRNGDGLDPWAGDIRLLALRVQGQVPWLLDLRHRLRPREGGDSPCLFEPAEPSGAQASRASAAHFPSAAHQPWALWADWALYSSAKTPAT